MAPEGGALGWTVEGGVDGVPLFSGGDSASAMPVEAVQTSAAIEASRSIDPAWFALTPLI
jgi:hypothetical protein